MMGVLFQAAGVSTMVSLAFLRDLRISGQTSAVIL